MSQSRPGVIGVGALELARYTPARLNAVARELKVKQRRLGNAGHPARRRDFVFRDARGDYWSLDLGALHWHRYEGGSWVRADPLASAELEGPAGLAPATEAEELAAEIRSRPATDNPATLIERIVADARAAYAHGSLDSTTAEIMASQWRVVDGESRIWTTGFHSGAWYVFESGMWHQAAAAPDPATLLRDLSATVRSDPALHDRLAHAFAELIESDEPLPEPVIRDWDPPAFLPGEEPARPSDRCRECDASTAGMKYCANCGTPVLASTR